MRYSAMLHARWQCARYSAPRDLVVYDEHPNAVPSLLKDNVNYLRLHPTKEVEWKKRRLGFADCYYGPAERGIAVRRAPRCFEKLVSGRPFISSGADDGVLYLGERTTASGRRWIVAVHPAGAWEDTMSMQFSFSVTRIPVDANIKHGEYAWGGGAGNISILWTPYGDDRSPPPHAPARFFAGQADRGDASRFTMEYEQKGRRGIVEGRVTDDGVCLTVLSGPAASFEDAVRRSVFEKRMAEFTVSSR